MKRYPAEGFEKALDLLKRISPVSWQHIHFLDYYWFRDEQNPIDPEAILASVYFISHIVFQKFQKMRGVWLSPPQKKRFPVPIFNSWSALQILPPYAPHWANELLWSSVWYKIGPHPVHAYADRRTASVSTRQNCGKPPVRGEEH